MWEVYKTTLQMVEGDFGIKLPITITGATFGAYDSVRITIKNGETTVIQKDFTNISSNTVDLEFTEAESSLLKVGSYLYSLDWYQDGAFMCNIIPSAALKVVDKA